MKMICFMNILYTIRIKKKIFIFNSEMEISKFLMQSRRENNNIDKIKLFFIILKLIRMISMKILQLKSEMLFYFQLNV